MSNPKVTIITPVLNAESTLVECLESVAQQSYKNIEHFIIDGLSTDSTLSIVKDFQNKYQHICLVSEKDAGIYDAMNKGIGLATGEWIHFLGADDILFDRDVLQNVFQARETEGIDVLYGNSQFKHSGAIYDGKFDALKLIGKNICHQSIFFRANTFQKLGMFYIKYRALADWEFNMRWFTDGRIRKVYIDQLVAIYNEDGYSFNNPDALFAADQAGLVTKYFGCLYGFLFVHRYNFFVSKLFK